MGMMIPPSIVPTYFIAKYLQVLSTFFFMGEKSADWNLFFTDVVLTSLPVIILYVLLQKYIISGMVSGSIKG
jgi:raffinose/stachyose/melibiose transport system permease protein